jgi:hypothetical protein
MADGGVGQVDPASLKPLSEPIDRMLAQLGRAFIYEELLQTERHHVARERAARRPESSPTRGTSVGLTANASSDSTYQQPYARDRLALRKRGPRALSPSL